MMSAMYIPTCLVVFILLQKYGIFCKKKKTKKNKKTTNTFGYVTCLTITPVCFDYYSYIAFTNPKVVIKVWQFQVFHGDQRLFSPMNLRATEPVEYRAVLDESKVSNYTLHVNNHDQKNSYQCHHNVKMIFFYLLYTVRQKLSTT